MANDFAQKLITQRIATLRAGLRSQENVIADYNKRIATSTQAILNYNIEINELTEMLGKLGGQPE